MSSTVMVFFKNVHLRSRVLYTRLHMSVKLLTSNRLNFAKHPSITDFSDHP